MQDNRRDFSDNEKMLLFNEVDGHVHMWCDTLSHKKRVLYIERFDIAQFYPCKSKARRSKNTGR
jgi:hypothetical protein